MEASQYIPILQKKKTGVSNNVVNFDYEVVVWIRVTSKSVYYIN